MGKRRAADVGATAKERASKAVPVLPRPKGKRNVKGWGRRSKAILILGTTTHQSNYDPALPGSPGCGYCGPVLGGNHRGRGEQPKPGRGRWYHRLMNLQPLSAWGPRGPPPRYAAGLALRRGLGWPGGRPRSLHSKAEGGVAHIHCTPILAVEPTRSGGVWRMSCVCRQAVTGYDHPPACCNIRG